MSHTPAPWVKQEFIAPNGSRYWRIVAQEKHIADAFRTVAQLRESEEDDANLIATSPELLAVAQTIFEECDAELWDELQGIDDGQRISVSLCAVDLKRLHAAIKKARGE